MRGSVILDRVNDRMLRQQWEAKIVKLERALKELNLYRQHPEADPSGMEYFQAVLNFAEVRDEERNFFWDSFVDERVPSRYSR